MSRELAARLLAVAGAALLVVGFFLPWMEGTTEFSARDFSGFDLARLVRNFEIATEEDSGKLRLTAVVLYAVPALAVNAAVFTLVPQLRSWQVVAAGVAAAYGLVVVGGVGLLATVSGTELRGVLGEAMVGWWVSVAGAGMMAVSGVMLAWLRRGAAAAATRWVPR